LVFSKIIALLKKKKGKSANFRAGVWIFWEFNQMWILIFPYAIVIYEVSVV